ncbi:DUF4329 domain-containing protein [Shimia ponticola]|uniref:DUF4329 domain-containing protein n=1 Tax=Shimia ponticola TaxID=2582893 RepID=UPI00164B6A83|nr:DUF4329 domain-containing protein [Shimia ponticola]
MRLALTLLALLPTAALAQSAEEIAIARATLGALQGPSFEENREYCGYLAYDADENLVATPASTGDRDSCAYDGPEDGYVMVLSYHTHAAFDPDYASEVPSVSDIETDEDEGIDGFVATPGGRLWYVDTTDMIVRQICGLGCLAQDPDFIEGADGEIAISYTYQDLLDYEAE